MRPVVLIPLLLLACKGGKDDDTDPVDCSTESTELLSTIAVSDWPAGLAEAIQSYEGLSGVWSASACGTQVRVTMTTEPDNGTIEVVDGALPSGHTCGCIHDPVSGDDGTLNVIAYASLDISVVDYPNEGFREENAGNVPDVTVAFFNNGPNGMKVRACAEHLVPPILGLAWTDTQITIRNGDEGVSGDVVLVGNATNPDACTLTNWTRLTDVP